MKQEDLEKLIELYNEDCEPDDEEDQNIILTHQSNADIAYRICKALLDDWDSSFFEEWAYSVAPAHDDLADFIVGLLDYTVDLMHDQ